MYDDKLGKILINYAIELLKMIVSAISDGYLKHVRNPVDTSVDINLYQRVWSRTDIGYNRRYLQYPI
jgi:hypothetical protein